MYYVHNRESRSPTWSPYSPNPRGKPRSDATLSQLIKELGIAAVPHGFRSSFRDWAAERGYRTQEDALHAVRGRIRFDDQIRRRFSIPLPIEVRYDD